MPTWTATECAWLNSAFTALSGPLRRDLIELIIETPGVTVNDVCALFPVSHFTIMRHLNLLESADLLYRQRAGTMKLLFINKSKLNVLVPGWLKAMGENL